MPPFQNPEKSFVIGFSDQARVEAMPKAEIPTGFYKLPQTFVTTGAPIVLPKFSQEVDADACLAIVIGKAGKKNPPRAGLGLRRRGYALNRHHRARHQPAGRPDDQQFARQEFSFEHLPRAGDASAAGAKRSGRDGSGTINRRQRQTKFTLRDCVFTIEQIIARWSILGIKPGDFLAIGASMALKGDRLQNPVPLKTGSNLRCFSPAIGEADAPGRLRREGVHQ